MSTSMYANAERLNLDEMLKEARQITGLEDIGDPDILPGMRMLLRALREEAHLSAMGVEAKRAALVQVIVNRLRIQALLTRHPEILDEPILGPVVIVGLPRSGTTKLLRMMAASSDWQTLPLWKILNPAPVGAITPGQRDPRIAIAEQVSAAMREHFPAFYAGHPMNAMDPDEEEWMLDLVARGYTNSHTARVPSYEAWMDQQDFDCWYAYLKIILQVLQWQDGSPRLPWLIKAPSHLRHLKTLFKHFPHATIAHCHRDPVTTITSLAGLIEAAMRMYSDEDTPVEVGEFTLRHWAAQMRGYMRDRPNLELDHPFVDVAYGEVTNDIMPAIERIYAAAGVTLSDESRAAMSAWSVENPPGKHGAHRYSIARYTLTEARIRQEFSGYLDRFQALAR